MSDQSPGRDLAEAAKIITEAGCRVRDAPPHHDDLRNIALATGHVLDALYALNETVKSQLANYGTDRQLGTVTDRSPEEVLASALTQAQVLRTELDSARRAARLVANEIALIANLPAASQP